MSQKVLGNPTRGLVFVLSAPAGTGKTTLVRMLTGEFDCVEESVSCTTRAIRTGEEEGRDYHFLTREAFQKKVDSGDFLEYAEVFGQLYGTSYKCMQEKIEEGKHVVLVIDTQGAMKLRAENFEAVYIFLAPPDLKVLEERLLKRMTEDEEKRSERLSWAHKELMASESYDYLIVNSDLPIAYEVLRSIVIAEEHKILKRK